MALPPRGLVAILLSLAAVARPAFAQEGTEERLRRVEQQNESLRLTTEALIRQNERLTEKLEALLANSRPAADVPPSTAGYLPAAEPQTTDRPQASLGFADGSKKDPAKKVGWHEVGNDLNLKTKWKDGFYAETEQKDFSFRLGGRIHQPWVFIADEDRRLVNDPKIGQYHAAAPGFAPR